MDNNRFAPGTGSIPVRHMKETSHSIFRKEAVEKYIREQENKVLPQFVSPRLFLFLWMFFVLLSGLGVWLCFAEIPVFVPGRGMIADRGQGNFCREEGVCITAFFPADVPADLTGERRLMLRSESEKRWIDQDVTIVESEVLSPAEVQKRYHAEAVAMPLPNQDTAVAHCRLARQKHDMRTDILSDGPFEVRIDVGPRRLGSYLPVLDRFFMKSDRSERKGI